jgi:perosamine synthetase
LVLGLKEIMKITSAFPSITSKEIKLVNEAIRSGWGSKMNYYIDLFAKKFSKYVGVKYCLPVAHCTDAIHLALLALNIKKGDEVLVPDLTWVASVAPVKYVGAKPIFLDIHKETLCIDFKEIEKKITKKTKALISVNLFGNVANYNEIKKICRKKNIFIIEDSAESLGAKYNSKMAGTFGDVSLFSFNATKLIMASQGGCLCTNNKKIYEKAKLFSHHGIDKNISGKYYWSGVLGYNYNWTNMQAACAIAQLDRINSLLKYKKKIYFMYKKYFSKIKNVEITKQIKGQQQSFWIVYANIKKKIDKEKFCNNFKKYNIDMRPMFYQISSMPPFKNKSSMSKNKNAKEISQNSVCLPNGYNLNEKKIKKISKIFDYILNDKY